MFMAIIIIQILEIIWKNYAQDFIIIALGKNLAAPHSEQVFACSVQRRVSLRKITPFVNYMRSFCIRQFCQPRSFGQAMNSVCYCYKLI